MRTSGFSLIEVLIAFFLVTALALPIISLIGSSSQIGQASLLEAMAIKYASELALQVQNLSVHLEAIRSGTGMDLTQILVEPELTQQLEQVTDESLMITLPGTQIGLFVSPLNKAFTKRRFQVEELREPADSNAMLQGGKFWRVSILLEWKRKQGSVGSAVYHLMLREPHAE